ncbi:hypothetical protein ATK17_0730 [Branchiibius hedensis]|uniref:YjbR protein n=1 Tax=Branchiibius hedensis TaxID=672460 RepID=A0A2Y8ZQ78_9MICO|nr:hypothetical protein [Branchiibius hedensis]PWJ24631.1 hypothetical protein ATK17_0730 [Branchiibius hedensis]SSA33448.1 hypothetical protein SAMN04489750_0730 [Branchiibius hedensis]
MATLDDVRRVLADLPGVTEIENGWGALCWRTKAGQIAWVREANQSDLDQLAELGQVWPDGTVIAARVASLDERAALIDEDPEVFFTIPHFRSWPSVLLVLDRIAPERLEEVLLDGWILRVPKKVSTAWLSEHGFDA